MSLPYDHSGLAAVTLTRVAVEEAQGPGPLAERMRNLVRDLAQRNGPDSAADLVIALARMHVAALDSVARSSDMTVGRLLDELELEQLEDL